jgi:hypothetical protein
MIMSEIWDVSQAASWQNQLFHLFDHVQSYVFIISQPGGPFSGVIKFFQNSDLLL